jgi:hypothetical protein
MVNPAMGRTCCQPVKQEINSNAWATDKGFDLSAWQVAHPSRQVESCGLLKSKGAKINTLDLARHNGTNASFHE